MTRSHLIQRFYHNVFNIKFALISAVFNGIIVAVINIQYGSALMPGLTQALSSFFSTGVTARIVQHFSPIRNPLRSYALGSFVPAMLTFVMSISGHVLNGTPNILLSSFPATLVSFVTSFVTNAITRRGYLRPPNYPKTNLT